MNDLSDLCQRVLRALIAAPIAWQAPIQIAAKLGGDRDATLDAIADLDSAGWLAPWEMDGDLHVILTPLAAERLGVKLVPAGKSETMRWAPIDDPEPNPRAPGRGQGDVDALDLIPDPSPGPEEEAEASERAERLVRLSAQDVEASMLSTLPRPSILLGSGLTPWPGPSESNGRACPGCGSEPISEKAYCLVCDRWGLDPLLAALQGKAQTAHRPRRPTPNAPSGLAQRTARAARKAKHCRKLVEREKQERTGRQGGSKPLSAGVRPEGHS